MITKKDFAKAIARYAKNADAVGTTYMPLFKLKDGRDVCLVIGYVDGYDKGEKYQYEDGDKLYTLCGKIAVNVDDLQCDYDVDWNMPMTRDGDVYDTETPIVSVNDYSYFITCASEMIDQIRRDNLVWE